MTEAEGYTNPDWQRVADAFGENFETAGEIGAACCVYADGKPVVDIWGGVADSRDGRRWAEETVVTVFSATKGATAICAHRLIETGDLTLDDLVVEHWPEYVAAGKGQTLVRWLLSHRAGVPAVGVRLSLEDLCAWDPVIRALEAQEPFWPPGACFMYHAQTWGFLVGELIRRVAGKSLGTLFAEQIAGPLGLSAWIGTPEEVEPRVAHLLMSPTSASVEESIGALSERLGFDEATRQAIDRWLPMLLSPPESVAHVYASAASLGGAFDGGLVTASGGHNSRAARAAEMPGSNMVSDARSLARMYAATVGTVDGIRLLLPETVATATAIQTPDVPLFGYPPKQDALSDAIGHMRLGFAGPSKLMPLLGPRSFGHPGAGGSIAFADPESGIAFAYVMNHMVMSLDDPRAANLVNAVATCLG